MALASVDIFLLILNLLVLICLILLVLFCIACIALTIQQRKSVYNILWISRTVQICFVVVWAIGLLLGLDRLWSVMGGKDHVQRICRAHVILTLGVGQTASTAYILFLLLVRLTPLSSFFSKSGEGEDKDNDKKKSTAVSQTNAKIMVPATIVAIVFAAIQLAIIIVDLIVAEALSAKIRIDLFGGSKVACQLPILSVVISAAYVIAFLISYNSALVKMRRRIVSIVLSQRLLRLQILISVSMSLALASRAVSVALFNITNPDTATGNEVAMVYLQGIFEVIAYLCDIVAAALLIWLHVLRPVLDARSAMRNLQQIEAKNAQKQQQPQLKESAKQAGIPKLGSAVELNEIKIQMAENGAAQLQYPQQQQQQQRRGSLKTTTTTTTSTTTTTTISRTSSMMTDSAAPTTPTSTTTTTSSSRSSSSSTATSSTSTTAQNHARVKTKVTFAGDISTSRG